MKKITILFLILTLSIGFLFMTSSHKVDASITDLTGTKWLLNESFTTMPNVGDFSSAGGVRHTYYINFISNSNSYMSLNFYDSDYPNAGIHYDSIVVWDLTSWISQNYRTIEIIGGENVTNTELIAWLQSNATQIQPGYSITYEENGGSSVTDLTEQTALPNPLPIPTRPGYTFLGWYYDSDFTNEAFADDPLTDDVTLYAKWELTTYTITYNTNGGSSVPQTSNATQLPDPLPITTKTGFTFLGWFYDSAFQTQAIAGEPISSDVTLYAKWDLSGTKWFINSPHLLALTHPEEDASEYWAIVFKSKGITFNQLYIEYFESGSTYLEYHTNVGTKIVVCVLDGEDIVYFDDRYANIEIISGETSSRLIEILDLIATLQTPIQNYTLSFVSNGGTVFPDRYINDRLTSLPIPERANSFFTGWYYDIELSQKANNNDLVSGDTVLYAGWILNSIYEDLTEARYSEGYSTGLGEGYSTGFDEGYDTGFGEGAGSVWEEAYEEGFRDALEIASGDIQDAWYEGYEFAKEIFGFQKDGKYYDGKSVYMLGYNDNDNLRKLFIPALVIIFIASIILSGINVFRRKE